jgi:hypothetical protein
LEFLILTAARTIEVLGAKWDEVDFEKRLWVVPASRMKIKETHRVFSANVGCWRQSGSQPRPSNNRRGAKALEGGEGLSDHVPLVIDIRL